MKNFIPINRKLFDHFLWSENRSYSKFEAWLDLLQTASYSKDNKSIINGMMCTWGRGQYPISISFLCNRWGWKDKAVRNYLKMLKNEKMISLDKTSKWTMLTICKYDSYNTNGQAEETSRGKQRASRGQELNKVNKDKKEIIGVWLDYRKAIKKPISNEKTLNSLIEKFNSEPLNKVEFVVNNSIANQWQGLFWDKFGGNKANNNQPGRRVSL